jgi:hypothetical protein
MTRRRFLQLAAAGAAASLLPAASPPRPAFSTRGVVLIPEDFTLRDWPERAQRAGLTTLALHHGHSVLEALNFANLRVFPAGTAQVLEYWLDVSRFSGWKRPAQKLPWNREVFLADLATYAARGIRQVTSFACYIDGDYLKRHGEPSALSDYGAGLRGVAQGDAGPKLTPQPQPQSKGTDHETRICHRHPLRPQP